EADEHFGRLREWGFTFVRFLVTWEAIEHAGPGIYDEAYLDYVRAIVSKAGEYGINLFIDPHQDVWSRFTGGDGAPGWTLEVAGFDMTCFHETGAAIVHATHGDPLPKMIWPTNGNKLAAATMFTLFFGGNDFAPRTRVEGEPIQEYLQRHYIEAIRQVALRLKDLPNVVGYDTLNEPMPGFIGWEDAASTDGVLKLGPTPTPYQAMLLGAGFPQEVGVWTLGKVRLARTASCWLNQAGARAWQAGRDCLWRENGVWDVDPTGAPRLLRPYHFLEVNGRQVDFNQDYYLPFAQRFARAIHGADPRAIIFAEPQPSKQPPHWSPNGIPLAYAPHWYDGFVLIKKSFTPYLAVDFVTTNPVFLPGLIRRSFARQLGSFRKSANERMGEAPVLLGEFGVPFDMDGKHSFRTGDYRQQTRALDRTFQALEANLLSGTLWNYTPDNTNEHGDLWNDEDLSIFSRDQRKDPGDIHSGGRALDAAIRPYPKAVAGEPLHLSFDLRRRTFEFSFRHDPEVQAPTEIFVPNFQYPQGYLVEVSDGS
ncbi:MAG TPA: cellulase family glycosylhydrolase, partial [Anaerolineaceae bacterium]|nr:cellulase family glycosylhydrolase [Anaerolineaceae bacterium]